MKSTNRRTVKELKMMLDCLPDDLNIQFSPITQAYLGANHPLTLMDSPFNFYNDMGELAMPSDPDAHCVIHICEDEDCKTSTYGGDEVDDVVQTCVSCLTNPRADESDHCQKCIDNN